MTPKKNRGIFTYLFVAAIFIVILGVMLPGINGGNATYKYSDIMEYFDEYQVSSYSLNLKTGELNMKLRDSEDGPEKISYTVPNVGIFLQDTDSELKDYTSIHG